MLISSGIAKRIVEAFPGIKDRLGVSNPIETLSKGDYALCFDRGRAYVQAWTKHHFTEEGVTPVEGFCSDTFELFSLEDMGNFLFDQMYLKGYKSLSDHFDGWVIMVDNDGDLSLSKINDVIADDYIIVSLATGKEECQISNGMTVDEITEALTQITQPVMFYQPVLMAS